MIRFKILMAAFMAIGLCACSQQKSHSAANEPAPADSVKKVMVAYFSATGTTAKVAKQIAAAAGDATLFEIKPATPYTPADLDWNNKQSRSTVEMNDSTSRPALSDSIVDLTDYDVVFIGYPIWWDLAPRQVNTFIESNNLKGKKLIPFATSGGSTITNSVSDLKRLYPTLNWTDGKLLNGESDTQIAEWVAESLK